MSCWKSGAAGSGPAIGRYPDWSPELALETMDRFEIATALTSLAQPGVQFCKPDAAKSLARRCNDYAAELNTKHGGRFGAFGTVSMWDVRHAVDEIGYALDTLSMGMSDDLELAIAEGATLVRIGTGIFGVRS